MKTVMTVADIREQLRRVSAQIRELSVGERYRSGAVRRRDELVRLALDVGLRPSLIKTDTGLARSRIYQIKNDRAAACGKFVTWWDGEYEGNCELPTGHEGPHFDGLSWWDDEMNQVDDGG